MHSAALARAMIHLAHGDPRALYGYLSRTGKKEKKVLLKMLEAHINGTHGVFSFYDENIAQWAGATVLQFFEADLDDIDHSTLRHKQGRSRGRTITTIRLPGDVDDMSSCLAGLGACFAEDLRCSLDVPTLQSRSMRSPPMHAHAHACTCTCMHAHTSAGALPRDVPTHQSNPPVHIHTQPTHALTLGPEPRSFRLLGR